TRRTLTLRSHGTHRCPSGLPGCGQSTVAPSDVTATSMPRNCSLTRISLTAKIRRATWSRSPLPVPGPTRSSPVAHSPLLLEWPLVQMVRCTQPTAQPSYHQVKAGLCGLAVDSHLS